MAKKVVGLHIKVLPGGTWQVCPVYRAPGGRLYQGGREMEEGVDPLETAKLVADKIPAFIDRAR